MDQRDAALLHSVGEMNKHLGEVLLEVMQPTHADGSRSRALRMLAGCLRDVADELEHRAIEIHNPPAICSAVTTAGDGRRAS
jgi:hypothetical protein